MRVPAPMISRHRPAGNGISPDIKNQAQWIPSRRQPMRASLSSDRQTTHAHDAEEPRPFASSAAGGSDGSSRGRREAR